MATIYLLRHGIAEDARGESADEERRLTGEGRRKVVALAKGLAGLRVAPKVVLTSPLVRAKETAKLAAEILSPKAVVVEYRPLAPGGGPEAVVRGWTEYAAAHEILLVGHEPSLGELASYLLTGSAGLVRIPFKKGAVAAIDVSSLSPKSPGALRWFMTAKQMGALRS